MWILIRNTEPDPESSWIVDTDPVRIRIHNTREDDRDKGGKREKEKKRKKEKKKEKELQEKKYI